MSRAKPHLAICLLTIGMCHHCAAADAPKEPPVPAASQTLADIETSIANLGSNAFDHRRNAFLEIWQLGPVALPSVRGAKSSDNLQVARAAAALESLLLLDMPHQDLGIDALELFSNPTPERIALLCSRQKWKLAEHLVANNATLTESFKEASGRHTLLKIAELAVAQGDSYLSWPIVRIVTASKENEYDGSNLSLWLAEKLDLDLDAENQNVDARALTLCYAGKVETAFALNVSEPVRRKMLTRSGRWDLLGQEHNQITLLGEYPSTASQAASAVLYEFSGNHEKSIEIWNEILGAPEAEGNQRSAVDALHAASTADANQLLLSLMLSGRIEAVEQFLAESNPRSAFGFYAAASDYVQAFKLIELEPDLSNFDAWLVQRNGELKKELARSFRGRAQFSGTLHVCTLLVRLGYKNEARRLLDTIVQLARRKTELWTDRGSIISWLGRGEPRVLCLEVVAKQIQAMRPETKRVILASLFPEFNTSAFTLARTAPPVFDDTGRRLSAVPILDRLHSWDTRYFAQQMDETTIADWLARAKQQLLTDTAAPSQPGLLVVQLRELTKLAKGCGLTDMAHQFAEVDLQDIGDLSDVIQSQWIDAAGLHMDEGDPAKAAEYLKKVRTTDNAGNNQPALIEEIRALLLAGDHQQAIHLERSRMLRPLAVTRFFQGANYSQTVNVLSDRNDFVAAREYAEIAFNLSKFSSVDTYWAASDLGTILKELNELQAMADVLRTPLVEALEPRSAILNFFFARDLHSSLRYAAKNERLAQAVAAIIRGETREAEQHIRVGQQLQPQDIEMVVQCYPRLVAGGETLIANKMFDSFEASMLKQIQLWPKDAMALNNLSWMYSQCDRKLDSALELAEKASSLAPNSATYLDTLAEVHFRSGRVTKAIELMEQCVRLDPREQHYRDNLARFEQPP